MRELWRHKNDSMRNARLSEKLERDLELGKIVLVGCLVDANYPTWQCVGCGASFPEATAEPVISGISPE